MRDTITKMVPVQETIYGCDYCSFRTTNNETRCGCAPVVRCTSCGKDVCRGHRREYSEDGDRPDAFACPECFDRMEAAWDHAAATAGRYDSWMDIVRGHLAANPKTTLAACKTTEGK